MTDNQLQGYMIVLPDTTRFWVGEGEHTNGYAVCNLIRDLGTAIDKSPNEMTEHMSWMVAELKRRLPAGTWWHEKPVD